MNNACIEDKELNKLVKEVEKKDKYLIGHHDRVMRYTMLLLNAYDNITDWTNAGIAAYLHDIGKIHIITDVLNKPEKLTSFEFDEIKKHPVYSYEILKEKLNDEVANFARWHHEKLNGSGYPDGITGDLIPLASRAMAIADIFDALTHSRSYRENYSFEEAISIMEWDVSKNHIDEKLFDLFKSLISTGAIVEGVDNNWIV